MKNGSDAMKTPGEVVAVFEGIPALVRAAAQRFVQLAQAAVAQHGLFTVALSGGSTPKPLYTLLADDPGFREAIPWPKIHFFFGDERHVPPDHAESNFRMASEALFQRLPGESLHVHRIFAECEIADEAAARYDAVLRGFFRSHEIAANDLPRFDLILLGMGADGHTASLFPGTPALSETAHTVVATRVEKFNAHRITMTFPVLNNAAEIILLVAGADKSPVIAEVLGRTADTPKYPVQMVRPVNGIKRWMIEKAAAPS